MGWRLLADAVMAAHFAFVAFVVFGSLLLLRWRRLAWLHVPVALYGAAIMAFGWTCPLTPLEQWLRRRAGDASYEGGFLDHYLVQPVLGQGLGKVGAIGVAAAVLILNVAGYAAAKRRCSGARR